LWKSICIGWNSDFTRDHIDEQAIDLVSRRKLCVPSHHAPVQVLCEVWLDNFWGEAVDQSKSERNLTRDLYSFGLVDLAFLTSSVTALSKG